MEQNAATPEWVAKLITTARTIVPRDFCGSVEINAYLGGITTVNVRQTFKPKPDKPHPS